MIASIYLLKFFNKHISSQFHCFLVYLMYYVHLTKKHYLKEMKNSALMPYNQTLWMRKWCTMVHEIHTQMHRLQIRSCHNYLSKLPFSPLLYHIFTSLNCFATRWFEEWSTTRARWSYTNCYDNMVSFRLKYLCFSFRNKCFRYLHIGSFPCFCTCFL